MNKSQRGFTLIELLIVIALLGALAVGLLAALDPFEQLKKGTDTAVRNTVSEVQGAIIRYYAIKNYMPWCADAACVADVLATTALSGMDTTIAEIVASGELKTDFSTLAGSGTLAKIFVTGSNTTATAAVCYQPTSKSFQKDPNTKFTDAGIEILDGSCKSSVGGTTNCYWCVK